MTTFFTSSRNFSLGLLATGLLAGSAHAQTVTSIDKNLVSAGENIVITGTGLQNVTQVLLDGQPMVTTNAPSSGISRTVKVPIGASSGYLRLATASNVVLYPLRIRVKRASSSNAASSDISVTMPTMGTYNTPWVTDLDGDGRIDVLVGDNVGQIRCFEQNANGTFPSTGTLLTANGATLDVNDFAKPTVTDLDGDGLLDLLVGTGTGRRIIRYEQLAGAAPTAFSAGTEMTTSTGATFVNGFNYPRPSATDLDGDGLIDVLVGDDSGQITWYEQMAAMGANCTKLQYKDVLRLTNGSPVDIGGTSKPAVVDWDGDGLLDLLVGGSDGKVYCYEQSGANTTTFVSLGAMKQGDNSTIDVGDYSAPTVTDMDGDGRMDLILGNQTGTLRRFEQGVAAAVVPLPVVLTAFEGKSGKSGNQLSWATAQEANSARFVVEASATGDAFAPVGTVAAAGTSSTLTTYLFLDGSDAALAAGRRYYRLRMEDADGTATYSPVVVLGRMALAGAETKADAYPNPFAEKLLVALPGYGEPQAVTATLSTLTGRPVYEARLQLGAAAQSLPGLPELPAGVYVLRLHTPAGVSTLKVTRQ